MKIFGKAIKDISIWKTEFVWKKYQIPSRSSTTQFFEKRSDLHLTDHFFRAFESMSSFWEISGLNLISEWPKAKHKA